MAGLVPIESTGFLTGLSPLTTEAVVSGQESLPGDTGGGDPREAVSPAHLEVETGAVLPVRTGYDERQREHVGHTHGHQVQLLR